MNVIGIMSGTSLDGFDFVLGRFAEQSSRFKDMDSVSFPKKLKEELKELAEGETGFRDSQLLHFKLGDFYKQSLEKIVKKNNWKFDLIGLHGQTVFHNAPLATTQIGEPSYLKHFDVPVVSDFRSKIISVGGQAAPLAPIFHSKICENSKRAWGFLNLGGMSNITYHDQPKYIATDLGPANVYLDKAAEILLNKKYDKGGHLARRGLPEMDTVKKYMKAEKFFAKKPPKSCGREEFSDQAFKGLFKMMKTLSPEDKMATLAEITLKPIEKFLKTNPVELLVVSGGGVKNQYLMKALNSRLYETEVITSDELGWPSQAVEGGAFAYLAYLKFMNKSADLSYMGIRKELSPLGRID